MNYRIMGHTGLKLSEIGFGAWLTFGDKVGVEEATRIVHTAYDHGVNYFDNSDSYARGRAEEVMAEAIEGLPREGLVISSKVFWHTMQGVNGRGLSRKHIMEACHASLRRLKLEYLDLYLCHRHDPETPTEEVVRAMDDLIHQGKILYWGTSEWRAAQIGRAHGLARQYGLVPPRVEQPHYNMLVRDKLEAELAPAAEQFGFGMVTWSPLRSGLLSGKYGQGIPEGSRLDEHEWLRDIATEENLDKVAKLSGVAEKLGVTLPQLAIGWLLRLPQVTSVITGASKAEQVEENVQGFEVVEKLTGGVLEEIESILGNRPVPEDN